MSDYKIKEKKKDKQTFLINPAQRGHLENKKVSGEDFFGDLTAPIVCGSVELLIKNHHTRRSPPLASG